MFTTEIDWDEICITLLDEGNFYEDIQFAIFSDIVYIRQWDDVTDKFTTIALSVNMFDEFLKALNLPEGAYYTGQKPEKKDNE